MAPRKVRTEREKMESQLAKYDEWIAELEKRRGELDQGKALYTRLFYAFPVLSLLGFLKNVGTGAACLFTAVLMTSFGLYTVRVRASDYRTNLEGSRKMAQKLRKTLEEMPP